MTKKQIEKQVYDVFEDMICVDLDTAGFDANLVDDLSCDDLDMVELIIKFKTLYPKVIDSVEFSKLKTPRDIVNYIHEKLTKKY